jgi:hypothetical protein
MLMSWFFPKNSSLCKSYLPITMMKSCTWSLFTAELMCPINYIHWKIIVVQACNILEPETQQTKVRHLYILGSFLLQTGGAMWFTSVSSPEVYNKYHIDLNLLINILKLNSL